MRVHCCAGLHYGVFQSLDAKLCHHEFYVNQWNPNKPKPDNVIIMNDKQLNNPQDFDALLVQGEGDYLKIQNVRKPIIYYHIVNAFPDYKLNWIYQNQNVIPAFLSTSTRMTWDVQFGLHKTIYHGIDEEKWSGWHGSDQSVVCAKNNYKQRDPESHKFMYEICEGSKLNLLGVDGDFECKQDELIDIYRRSRAYISVEALGSVIDTAAAEAMMTGLPIISRDIQSVGEFVRNGVEGYISNNPSYLKKKIRDVLNDHELAKYLGNNAREMAKKRFSKSVFNQQWNDFLDNLDYYRRI
jgi:hypothetical protein